MTFPPGEASGGGLGGWGRPAAKTKHPAIAGCLCSSFYCSFLAGLGPRIAMRCISMRPRRFRMSFNFSSTVTGSIFFSWVFMVFDVG